ncbi:MAG: glucose-1-phosphate thymidylyltransferase RfbA [Alphaproteobacteria bacterium]|nr:glucose-1-phosphate thymidylyltransferase RfbA [Alphaproteobacteria bacterium]MDE2336030.1 glucose-1-phosphate thymidylyltransferase RfbA [Alphaproteobacteria bacterium]
MKGIILAGGSGTRLYPLTQCVSKQLLPVYDKPVIHYPLATMVTLGVKDILIISTPADLPHIERMLGDGKKYGLNLSYKVQDAPKGIAEAFILGADFIGKEKVCLLLGDNIFFITNNIAELKKKIAAYDNDAFIFGTRVPDPERFGVIVFEETKQHPRVVAIEEKPALPKSNYAATGLYIYPPDVVEKARAQKPSARGELEITDLNNAYIREGRLQCETLRRGSAWIDVGTPKSLMRAARFVEEVENLQSLKLSCIEEITYRLGFVDAAQFERNIGVYAKGSDYRVYLEKILNETSDPD